LPKPLRTAALVVYNLVIVCAILGLAEYAARYYVSVKQGGTTTPSILFDPWTEYHNNPAYQRPWLHHTAQGFRRDHEVSLAKPANTVRIFLVGGSVAYGAQTLYPEIDNRWQISDHETIDYYLGQKLDAAFPERHWEVINAAVRGYRVHHDLAQIESVLLRYKPDCIILLDGVNDTISLLHASEPYDPYTQTELREEFENVTNSHSLHSLGIVFSTWLQNNSVLYQRMRERLLRRAFARSRESQARTRTVPNSVQFADLSESEKNQYRIAASGLENYLHVVRQIHALLAVDGVEHLFALQPHLLVTHKELAGTEPRLAEYHRAVVGALAVYGFETLYPELANQLAGDASKSGYRFLNLIGVFDKMNEQTFTDECHLTPAGDRAISDAIFDEFQNSFRALVKASPR
jgi:lysophospholipase L1-like esterase